MTALCDITGVVFGRLTVIERAPNNAGGKAMWRCGCSCGSVVVTCGKDLRGGRSRSCGCLPVDSAKKRFTSHGHYRGHRPSAEYCAWQNMKKRCANPRGHEIQVYAARGIKVCDRWENSFEAFLEDMGPRPSGRHSIDRIENQKGYEPGNCRWALPEVQAGNRDYCIMVDVNGEPMNLAAALRATGSTLSRACVKQRLKKGWSHVDALQIPAGSMPAAA